MPPQRSWVANTLRRPMAAGAPAVPATTPVDSAGRAVLLVIPRPPGTPCNGSNIAALLDVSPDTTGRTIRNGGSMVRLYMKSRQTDTPTAAAAKASISTASAYRIEQDPRMPSQKKVPRERRRPDPLAGIFDEQIVPLLEATPALRPVALYEEPMRRHPEPGPGIRRTLERRVRAGRSRTRAMGSSPRPRPIARARASASGFSRRYSATRHYHENRLLDDGFSWC